MPARSQPWPAGGPPPPAAVVGRGGSCSCTARRTQADGLPSSRPQAARWLCFLQVNNGMLPPDQARVVAMGGGERPGQLRGKPASTGSTSGPSTKSSPTTAGSRQHPEPSPAPPPPPPPRAAARASAARARNGRGRDANVVCAPKVISRPPIGARTPQRDQDLLRRKRGGSESRRARAPSTCGQERPPPSPVSLSLSLVRSGGGGGGGGGGRSTRARVRTNTRLIFCSPPAPFRTSLK